MARTEQHKFIVKDAVDDGDPIYVGDLSDKWVQIEVDGAYIAGEIRLQGMIAETWVNEGVAISTGQVIVVPPTYLKMRVRTSIALNPPGAIKVTLAGRHQRTE